METTIISFLPILIMQAIYAVFIAQIAKRTGKNVPFYILVSLIPLVGAFFFIYVMWSTVLRVLDSINELKTQKAGSI